MRIGKKLTTLLLITLAVLGPYSHPNIFAGEQTADSRPILERFQDLLEAARRENKKDVVYMCLLGIGTVYAEKGENTKALTYLQQALKEANAAGDKETVATILLETGIVYRQLKEPDRALDFFQQSFKTAKDFSDKEVSVKALVNSAQTYEALFDFPRALDSYRQALKQANEFKDKDMPCLIAYAASRLSVGSGDYYAALEYAQQSLKLAKIIPNNAMVASNLLLIGTIYYIIPDYSRALEYLHNALVLSKQINDKKILSQAIIIIGNINRKFGEYDNALADFRKALELTEETDNKMVPLILFCIGETYCDLNRPEQALDYFQRSLKITEEAEDRFGTVTILGDIGRTYSMLNNPQEGLKYAKKALDAAIKMDIPDYIWKFYGSMGNMYLKTGKINEAMDCYKKSIKTMESIREKLKLEVYKLNFVENKMGIYENMVTLLAARGEKREAFDYVERSKSRALLDLLADKISSGPEDSGFASLLDAEPLKSGEVKSLLDKNTTLLEYYVTQNQLFIWIITNAELNEVTVPVTEKELRNEVASLREYIQTKSDDYKGPAHRLYSLLIEPAKPYLKTDKLCIVPHKTLHYLAFPALLDNDGRFLIEKYNFSYSPNASLLKYCLNKKVTSACNLIAFGNPDDSLETAETEVKQIIKDFKKAEVFIKDAASETNAKKLSGEYEIIHFACHGEFNPYNPIHSNLKLAKDDREDGNLEAWEIYSMDLKNTRLVTLSACQTAISNITSGDEIIGLIRGFIYAGSPSVIASLWDIDDVSTSILMREFYYGMKHGYSKAEALRLAQLKLINTKASGVSKARGIKLVENSGEHPVNLSHPYYWAAFTLIGDWK